MRKKTLILNEYEHDIPAVGDKVILVERVREGENEGTFSIVPYNSAGIGGNMNAGIKRLHGWRGTTDGVAKYAHGVREVIRVVPTKASNGMQGFDRYKVTVGKDILPDEE